MRNGRRNAAAALAVTVVMGLFGSDAPAAASNPFGLAGAAPAITATPAAVAQSTVATVPRPDHLVVVVMENHSASAILGNPMAPYLNSLAGGGASMTQSYAVTHPSQPNYLALFSGDPNGVVDDSCPKTLTAPDLGSALISAGLSFAGYSEDLPSVGFTGCGSGAYARKHNPWVDFPAVPASANQPMTAFPVDAAGYGALPAVSFVIPNLFNDMHDGTVAQGDTWLHDHLDGYAQWAASHNSVLVVTFDEDDNTAGNKIATVFTGARVVTGTYPEHIDHYSVLRTIEDAFGLTPIGRSATTAPILDIWTTDPAAPTASAVLTCQDLTCTADGTGSTPGPGAAITGYRWSWGDGSAGSYGSTATHTYPTGDFTVGLTVTDDQGRASTTTVAVQPRPAGQASLLASDAFDRTITTGLGSAPVGGAWSMGGSAAQYSVTPGAGRLTAAKAGAVLTAGLPSVSSVDTDLRMTLAEDRLATGSGLYLGVVGRQLGNNLEYQGRLKIRADGSIVIGIQAFTGTTTATVVRADAVLPGVTVLAGSRVATRLQVVGTNPTTLRWKVWPASVAEPAAWSQTGSDSIATLQAPGSVGVYSYLAASSTIAPVTTLISAVSAQPTAAPAPPPPPPPPPPTNQPPVGVFTSTCTGLSCTVDGTGSTDPDGSVTGWSWNWGDGSPAGAGATATHVFSAGGTYQVTLTVADNGGSSSTLTHLVTVTAPDSRFLLDAFGRTVSGGFGSADRGGAWSTTGTANRFSVAGGAGSMVLATPGSALSAALPSTTSTATDLRLALATDRLASNSGTYLTVVGRRVATNTEYQATVRIAGSGAVVAGLAALAGSATAVSLRAGSTVPGLAAVAGTPLRVRFQVAGTAPTSLRLKVWSSTAAEPAAWTAVATDSTAVLQAKGSVALTAYLSSGSTVSPIAVRVSDLSATPAVG